MQIDTFYLNHRPSNAAESNLARYSPSTTAQHDKTAEFGLMEQTAKDIAEDLDCLHEDRTKCLNSSNSQCHLPCATLMQYCLPEQPSELDSHEFYDGYRLLTSMNRLRTGAFAHCTGCLLILDAITTNNFAEWRLLDFDILVHADFPGSHLQLNIWYNPNRKRRQRDDPPHVQDIHLEVFRVQGMWLVPEIRMKCMKGHIT